jgi:hypothetical protein
MKIKYKTKSCIHKDNYHQASLLLLLVFTRPMNNGLDLLDTLLGLGDKTKM